MEKKYSIRFYKTILKFTNLYLDKMYKPVVKGVEFVKDEPTLFIGNHISGFDESSRIYPDGCGQAEGKAWQVAHPGEDLLYRQHLRREPRHLGRHVCLPSQNQTLVLCNRNAGNFNCTNCVACLLTDRPD